MKMKLAVVVACGALAGFVIAATKPLPREEPSAEEAAPPVSTPAPGAATSSATGDAPAAASGNRARAETPERALPGAIPERSDAGNVPADEPSDRPSSRSLSRTTKNEATPPQLINTEIGAKDLQFLLAAIEDGYTQLYLGQLAQSRAETEQIKAVGIVLSSTQAEENKKLTRLASMKGIALPGAAAAGQKRVAAKLEKLQGPRFEKQLMEEIINANEHAVANFEAAASTRDSDIRAFVEEALPLAKEKLLLTTKMTGTARRSDKEPGFRGVAPAPPDTRER